MHGVGDLFKCGDIGADYKVILYAVFFGGHADLSVNVDHICSGNDSEQ